MTDERDMALGGVRPIDGSGETRAYGMPCDHLLTHGVVVGMTGSGKTGLLMVLVEEALRSSVPVIMVDIKGDLPNLLLTFPNLAAEEFRPWVERQR
jgi:DNA helicase HerA-like ATPase